MKLIITYLLTLGILLFINSQLLPIPRQDIQLTAGLFEGSDLFESFGLKNCTNDIQDLFSSFQNISFENKIKTFAEFSKIIMTISNIFQKCPDIETKTNSLIQSVNKAYHFPGQFLSEGLENVFGFSMLKKLWDLESELKKEDLTEAGKIIGEILRVFVDSSFFKDNNFNLNFLQLISKNNDDCLDLLEKIKINVEDMISFIHKDLSKFKNALDDFLVNLKNVPSKCI